MKKIAFLVALFISLCTLAIVLPTGNVQADWLDGYDMARDSSNLPENYADNVVLTVLQWILLMFTFVSVIAFTIAGMMFLTSGGNTQQAETAKNYVRYAIIGIAVGLSGYIVIAFIDRTLGGNVQQVSG